MSSNLQLHLRVLKELAEELSELLSVIFLKSWETGEVAEVWRRVNVVPIFKKGKKEEVETRGQSA